MIDQSTMRFSGEAAKSNEGLDQQVEQAGGAFLGRTEGETTSTGGYPRYLHQYYHFDQYYHQIFTGCYYSITIITIVLLS